MRAGLGRLWEKEEWLASIEGGMLPGLKRLRKNSGIAGESGGKRRSGAKQAAEKLGNLDKAGRKRFSRAKAQVILLALSARLKSRPDTKPPRLTAKMSFSARRGE